MMKTKIVFVFVFLVLFVGFYSLRAHAQPAPTCQPGITQCQMDADCHFLIGGPPLCPTCFICDNGVCVADDTVCEGNLVDATCVSAVCLDNPPADPFANPTGCEYTVSAFDASGQLDELCYYCDPATLSSISTCGNGVCNADIEDCSSCPEDCQVPGWDQPTCPVDPNTVNPDTCFFGITFDGPPYNTFQNCEDGDVCTEDFCQGSTINACASQPKSCSQDTSDLCCAAGCQGPPSGLSCLEADQQGILPRAECDIDCWPPQSCGDGLVEQPETCDDTVPGPNAGINVTDGQCRDAGNPGECTYCGDGLIQADAGEECDGTNDAACGGEGCNTDCTCNVPVPTGFCVTGSGHFWSDIRPGCANCSLNPHATTQGWWVDYRAFFLLLALLGSAWMVRRRIS